MEGEDTKKRHRQAQAGPKAKKKKAKSKHEQDLTPQQRNPKAFAIQHARKTAKIVQRSQDIKTKKQHIPLVDRTPLEPPPVVVAIVGPPKVGKTTLLQCLVKNYTRQRLTRIQGPVTVVSGKSRRLTLVECNNDVNSMIDIAKVADLVLLLVDASFGFEMETFEFLNICQVHGFPRIMGVLTHLDAFKDNKQLRKTKKRLKNRFWTEVYQGAKLFYLSGMVNGEYQKTEVHNLCRFISVMKFRPLQWRITHPYVVVDRMEDISDPEMLRQQPKCDRKVSLYGYVRGTHMKNHINVHIPGCGDYSVQDMHFLPDPCPLPGQEKKRSLNQKERLIYAPMSGVGGIIYDKDAVYIDLGGSHSHKETDEDSKPLNELVASLMSVNNPLNEKITSSHVTMFSNTAPISDVDVDMSANEEMSVSTNEPIRRQAVFEDESSAANVKKNQHKSDLAFDDSDDETEGSQFKLISSTNTRGGKSQQEVEMMSQETQKSDATEGEEQDGESGDEDDEFSGSEDSDDEHDDSVNEKNDKATDHSLRKKFSSSKEIHSSVRLKNDQENEEDDSADEDEDEDDDDDDDDDNDSDVSESDSDGASEIEEDRLRMRESTVQKKQKLESVQLGKVKTSENQSKVSKLHTQHKTNQSKIEVGDSDEDDEVEDSDDEEDDDDDSVMENSDDEDDDVDATDKLGNDKDVATEESGEMEKEEEEEGFIKWKTNLAAAAAESFKRRQTERINYRKLIYGKDDNVEEAEEKEDEDDLAGLFKILKSKSDRGKDGRSATNQTDCSKFVVEKVQGWELEEVQDLIRDCFVTGQWDKGEDAATRLKEDDEMFGDFEDLETGEVHRAFGDEDDSGDEGEDDDEENENKDGEKKDEEANTERKKTKAEMTAYEKRVEKKRKLKEMFDSEYDMKGDTEYYDQWKLEMEQQAKLNRAEFDNLEDDVRVGYEGFRPGMYVRVEIDKIPCEFVTNFNPSYPVILGGLLNVENNIGYVQARVKKHRWYKKILKTRNPLIISLGWRRFQTIPLYSIQDHNLRNRLLKYTPEHMHCHGSFWGPITPQGTGLLAVESVDGTTATPGFRIAATGVVLELDKSMQIVKKLKLTGTPNKIFRKTAFIQGMFSSILEVTKFEGAKIRTVSGIRGQVKKGLRTPEGAFRATFEDKILMSDIVFMRTWFPVEVPQFYATVTSLLLPHDQKISWRGMRTLGQLRKDNSVPVPKKQDSMYKPVERKKRYESTLKIPKDLQKELPFKDTPKLLQRKKDPLKRIAVVMEPQEAKVSKLMKMLKTLHDHRRKSEHVKMRQRASQHEKDMEKIGIKKAKKQKEVKKEIFRVLGQIEKKKNKYRH